MLKICTFNIQNNYDNYNLSKTKELFNFLIEKEIDILCLQEVFDLCQKDLRDLLKQKNYDLSGAYRFKLKILKRINEATPIITRVPVLSTKTYHLPFLPSGLKRVLTKVKIQYENEQLVIYNTHLDYQYALVKKRQLKRIIRILKREKFPIILTGDFNLKVSNEIFQNFIKELEQLGIYHVEFNEKTWKNARSNKAIDHIFLDKRYKVIKKEVVKTLNMSDHYPVMVEINKQ